MSDPVERGIYDTAAALQVPVLVAALLAVALVVVELGAFVVEVRRRRRRDADRLAAGAESARAALDRDDRAALLQAAVGVASSPAMASVAERIATVVGGPRSEARVAKALADFDLANEGRLARTRLLVRFGPALGLMGTLIPLSPALEGLAQGKIAQLSENLRLAFSVTVLGLLVGAVAFGLSLYRDRFASQDYSDLEYLAAVLTEPAAPSFAGRRAP